MTPACARSLQASGRIGTMEAQKGKRKAEMKRGSPKASSFNLEREKSLELSTYTLARYRSTN